MKKRQDKEDASDVDAFERAMSDVIRLGPDPRGRVRRTPHIAAPRETAPSTDPVAEPDGDFAAHGVGRRELRRLKRGDYAVDTRIDLHGMTGTEASAEVRRFIDNNRHRRHRCVCIVHGRGLHSEGHVSILKTRVRECLRSHPAVLAYVDAPRSDGGGGAVYVLLRR